MTQLTIMCIAIGSMGLAAGLAQPPRGPTEPRRTAPPAWQPTGETQPNLERQRSDAEEEARRLIDPQALAAIQETRAAVRAIADEKFQEAQSAIERAAAKTSAITARNSLKAAPVAAEADVIDAAPMDVRQIKSIADAVESAVSDKDYTRARALLHSLTSEVRVRSYHLPLETYPDALSEAARLLDEKRVRAAREVLMEAINTPIVVDRVTPLPLVLARAAIEEAHTLQGKDRDEALRLMASAKGELERAVALGYAGRDPAYDELTSGIVEVEKQLRDHEDASAPLSRLRQQMTAFFNRQARIEKTSAP